MSYGDSKIGTPWRGYYITAYGIAVKHGFKGTEEEWLASLQGADGRSIEIRYNDVTNVLEWKFTDDDAWTQLLDLEQLQTEIVAQTLAQAQAAQQAAEAAQAAAEASQQEAERNAGVTQADASITQTNVQLSQDAKTAAQAAQAAAETAQQAAEAAQAAAETAETGAEESATLSKSWAVGGTGTRPGEDTNNAEYWAGQAAAAAGGGVISFNGRSGTVLPLEGDYNADKVGAANKELSNLDSPQSALASLGGRPRANLAINGCFDVWQKGTVFEFTGGNETGPDRWRNLFQKERLERAENTSPANCEWMLRLTNLSSDGTDAGGLIIETIEDLSAGETITVSAFVQSLKGEIRLGIDSASPIVVGEDWQFVVVTKKASSNAIGFGANLGSDLSAGYNITGIKIERGNFQTNAYQDSAGVWHQFEAQDYGEELARCQRNLLMGPLLGVPVVTLLGGYRFFVATPQTMRTNPVIIGTPKVFKFSGVDDTENEVSVSSFNTVLENNGVYVYATGEFDGTTLCRLLFPAGSGLSAEL